MEPPVCREKVHPRTDRGCRVICRRRGLAIARLVQCRPESRKVTDQIYCLAEQFGGHGTGSGETKAAARFPRRIMARLADRTGRDSKAPNWGRLVSFLDFPAQHCSPAYHHFILASIYTLAIANGNNRRAPATEYFPGPAFRSTKHFDVSPVLLAFSS
jgi:hypothetical protein